MTNTTQRERFKIEQRNSSIVSRVIGDAIAAGLVRVYDESVGNRARRYVPGWA